MTDGPTPAAAHEQLVRCINALTPAEKLRLAQAVDQALPTRRPTKRELEMLTHAAQGHPAKQASYQLGISEETGRTHLRNAREKLGVVTVTHAVTRAIHLGYLPPDIGR